MKKVILFLILLLAGTGLTMIPVQAGILLSNEKGDIFHFIPWDSEEIIIGWRHSVELTPWKETYRITQDGDFSFESTTYQSYGAGTPDTDGNVEFLSDGFIRVTGIERTISHYSLFYVPISKYYVADGPKKYTLSRYVPDNTNVQIHYKQLKVYEWIWTRIENLIKEG
ncbi:MAG TPA: DUF1850 domain-containing protein [Candidatus Avamphibacillus sp.]|nr:DUF1850 domain-containing protein [Candidatus Avamphibacillus sp.]